jgi:phospholipid/cholesterol/gamma-HCH transport system permease protein
MGSVEDRPASIAPEKPDSPCELQVDSPQKDTLQVHFKGSWTLEQKLPGLDDIKAKLTPGAGIQRITFDTQHLADWDSGLLTFLVKLSELAKEGRVAVDQETLPDGIRKLLALAAAVPERKGARRAAVRESRLARIGGSAESFGRAVSELLEFIGECVVAGLKIPVGKARFQGSDLLVFFQDCGASALPIVTLISVLFGLILAFIGAIQLLMFGAQLYVANLVAIGVVRVMGAVMCGIIMAGRTGAAFAAQLGTMQVNEEIDALRTLGISPIEFLVLPRMLALVLMMPLLCIYADLMGILGGLIVGVGMLNISLLQYIKQTQASLNLNHFIVGLIHATTFGVLIALFGCLKGMQCGRSASAVGDATTSAVVASIVAIVVATAVITVVCNILGV